MTVGSPVRSIVERCFVKTNVRGIDEYLVDSVESQESGGKNALTENELRRTSSTSLKETIKTMGRIRTIE